MFIKIFSLSQCCYRHIVKTQPQSIKSSGITRYLYLSTLSDNYNNHIMVVNSFTKGYLGINNVFFVIKYIYSKWRFDFFFLYRKRMCI